MCFLFFASFYLTSIRAGDEKEPTFAEKLKQSKKAMEDRVRAKRPSLIERLEVISARDRAKARSLKAMAGALREAYGENSKNKGSDDWLERARQDDLLDDEDFEFLKLTERVDGGGVDCGGALGATVSGAALAEAEMKRDEELEGLDL